MLKTLAALFGLGTVGAGKTEFPQPPAEGKLRYKVSGYAETRDAITWVASSAPKFDFGLSLDEVFMSLEHGYQSVRAQLKDPERIAQWQESREKMREAHFFFAYRDIHEGKKSLYAAGELFTTLRRIGGKKVSRQELGDTEHGANELDE